MERAGPHFERYRLFIDSEQFVKWDQTLQVARRQVSTCSVDALRSRFDGQEVEQFPVVDQDLHIKDVFASN